MGEVHVDSYVPLEVVMKSIETGDLMSDVSNVTLTIIGPTSAKDEFNLGSEASRFVKGYQFKRTGTYKIDVTAEGLYQDYTADTYLLRVTNKYRGHNEVKAPGDTATFRVAPQRNRTLQTGDSAIIKIYDGDNTEVVNQSMTKNAEDFTFTWNIPSNQAEGEYLALIHLTDDTIDNVNILPAPLRIRS